VVFDIFRPKAAIDDKIVSFGKTIHPYEADSSFVLHLLAGSISRTPDQYLLFFRVRAVVIGIFRQKPRD